MFSFFFYLLILPNISLYSSSIFALRMELVACLSTGKGTWGHVSRLIQDQDWEKIFLITNDFGKENFSQQKPSEFIVVDSRKPMMELRDEIKERLKDKIKCTEVALNMASGTGKEHMALLSALLQLGVGIRIVALTKEGIQEL